MRISELGLPLQQRFRIFALHASVQGGLFEQGLESGFLQEEELPSSLLEENSRAGFYKSVGSSSLAGNMSLGEAQQGPAPLDGPGVAHPEEQVAVTDGGQPVADTEGSSTSDTSQELPADKMLKLQEELQKLEASQSEEVDNITSRYTQSVQQVKDKYHAKKEDMTAELDNLIKAEQDALEQSMFVNCSKAEALAHEILKADLPLLPGSDEERHVKASLRNYCKIKSIADARDEFPGIDHQALNSFVGKDFEPAGRDTVPEGPAAKNGPVWKLAEVRRTLRKRRLLAQVRGLMGDVNDPEQLKELRTVYGKLNMINSNLQGLLEVVQGASTMDWKTAGTKNGFLGMLAKGAKAIAKGGAKLLAFCKELWKNFLRSIRASQEVCVGEDQERARKGAEAVNLNPEQGLPEDMSAEQVDSISQKISDGLDKTEESANDHMDENQVKQSLEKVASDANRLKESLPTQTNPRKIQAELEQNIAETQQAEASVCKMNNKGAIKRLKEFFNKARKKIFEVTQSFGKAVGRVIKNATEGVGKVITRPSLPQLGIRGLSGSAFGLGGGIEEVIDFRNREIATFKFRSGAAGSASVGVSAGGYMGFGWKGYKENYTLEEGYITALTLGVGVGASVPMFWGLELGLGVTFATDADDSNPFPHPWIPDPLGINGITFGFSAGASLDVAQILNPLKLKQSYGMAYYWMLGSECFDSLKELLHYVWWPKCKRCFNAQEKLRYEAIRTAIKFGSLTPFFGDAAIDILARLYDSKIREPDYQPVCSMGSMNNRHNVKMFALDLTKLLLDTVRLADKVEELTQVVWPQLQEAARENPKMMTSTDLKKFEKGLGKNLENLCPVAPPLFGEDVAEVLGSTADDELKNMCTSFQLDDACQQGDKLERISRLRLFTELRAGGMDRVEMQQMLTQVGKIPCYTLGSKFSPANMMFQGSSHETTAEDCQRRCQSLSSCGHFTFWADHTCHVQAQNVKLKTNAGAVLAGPKICDRNLRTQDYLQKFQSLLHGCNGTHQCASGLDIARMLEQSMSQDDLVKLCLLTGGKCCRRSSYMGSCTWLDKELLAFRAVNALGGGTLSLANREMPFGKCTNDNDCTLPNTACIGEEGFSNGKLTRRRCACTPGNCFNKGENNGGVCERQTGDIDQVMDVAMRNVVSQKIEIGRLMFYLRAALKGNSSQEILDAAE
eukprot:TRINITY_DN19270_c0_g1_i1.p1 TRINITY_DN19270_c0_g1~~TRINITY_DN19270_c0_g1_i1.p1  ORF type:complete len:1283 (-),score=243.89 TRINITY_DN19270_c0_g1_i1:20-3571(-)